MQKKTVLSKRKIQYMFKTNFKQILSPLCWRHFCSECWNCNSLAQCSHQDLKYSSEVHPTVWLSRDAEPAPSLCTCCPTSTTHPPVTQCLPAAAASIWAQIFGSWRKDQTARLIVGQEKERKGKRLGRSVNRASSVVQGGFYFIWETTGHLRKGLCSWG